MDSTEVDNANRCHVVYRRNNTAGIPQYFHRWYDGSAWRGSQVTNFIGRFDMKGGGTLRNPLSRPNLFLDPADNVYLLYRDSRQGGLPRAVLLRPPTYDSVQEFVLAQQNLRQWEPTFDVGLWKREQVLSLPLLSSDQGDHEKATTSPAELLQVLDITLEDLRGSI